MEAGALSAQAAARTSGGRRSRAFPTGSEVGLTALSAGVLALIGYFFVRLYIEAKPALSQFGPLGFTFTNNWDVQANQFGALPLVVGTLITSAVALVIGVPTRAAAPRIGLPGRPSCW